MKQDIPARTYHHHFWKNLVWLWLIIGAMGIGFLLVGGLVAWYMVSTPGQPVLLLLLVLVFGIPGWALVYSAWVVINESVVFTKDSVKYRYPGIIPLWSKEINVLKKSITAVALGHVAMSSIYPEFMRSPQVGMIPRELRIMIKYKEAGEDKTLVLPAFQDPAYFSEIKKLIEEQKLSQTRIGFIFKRKE